MTKVVGVLGAANPDGITAQMLNAVLAGARDQGCAVEKIVLNDEQLRLTVFQNENVCNTVTKSRRQNR